MPETLDRVCRVVADVLGLDIEVVDLSMSQEQAANWDSLRIVHLSMALEEEFSIRFSPEEAISLVSVENIVSVLSTKDAR